MFVDIVLRIVVRRETIFRLQVFSWYPYHKKPNYFSYFKAQIRVHKANLGIYYVNSYYATSNFGYYLPHLSNSDINLYKLYCAYIRESGTMELSYLFPDKQCNFRLLP
jgi:hypothetical protein